MKSARSHARWWHSLRVRLVLLFLLLGLAMSAVFVGGIQKGFAQGWREAARPLVQDYVNRLGQEIGNPPDVARADALAQRLPIAIGIHGPTINWDSEPLRKIRPPGSKANGVDPGAWFTYQTADGHQISFDWSLRGPHGRLSRMVWFTLGALLLLTALAYWLVHRMLLPLRGISAGARRFGAGDFSHPIPVREHGKAHELAVLAQDVNRMAGNLQQMLDAKRGILLAISHELRSPLTRARLHAELLPDAANTAAAASRDALLRDLNLMRDLIQDLLESERLSSPHAALQREPTNLIALAQDTLATLTVQHPVAAQIAVHISPGLPLLPLDQTRMRLLLRNLLDNALRHSPPEGTAPDLTLQNAGNGGIVIEVRDHGSGVDDAQLPHLSEAFYRPDSARQRSTGGVGLGLYLCRLVAQAHGGTFEVRNAHPGLAVTVILPANATQYA